MGRSEKPQTMSDRSFYDHFDPVPFDESRGCVLFGFSSFFIYIAHLATGECGL
jgi:hypothetical protein